MAHREIFLRLASGRIHRATLDGDRRLVDERCNVDDASGPVEEVETLPDAVEASDLCGYCFPAEARPS